MRLFYLANQYFPSTYVDSIQVIKTAEALAGAGVEFTLVVPRLGETIRLSEDQLTERIASFYGLTRIDFSIRYIATLAKSVGEYEKELPGLFYPFFLQRKRVDLVYTRYFVPFLSLSLTGIPFLFETHRMLSKINPYRHAILKRVIGLKRCLGIVTIAECIRNRLIEEGFPAEKLVTIRNGFDPDEFKPRIGKKEARRICGLPESASIVFYGGTIGPHKDIEFLLDLASTRPEVVFCIAGRPDGAIVALVAARDNIRLVGWLDPRALSAHLFAADILIIPPTSKPYQLYGRTVLPIKTYQYLAAERPIIAPDQEDIREVLNRKNARLVPLDNIAATAEAIDEIIGMETGSVLAEQAGKDALDYTWSKRAERILVYLNRSKIS